MVVGIGEILTFNRKCTIFVGLLFAVIFITLTMVPSQADDDDSINKASNQIAVDTVYPENTIGAQSDTYFDKVNQLLTVRHVNRGSVLNIELSSSQDLTKPVITDLKVEPNTSVSIINPAIASAYVEDENLFYIDFEFIDLNNLIDTDTMLLWYHINDSGINDTYFSPPWYANAWNITNGTVDDIVTTITDADWPDNIIIMGNFTQNATSEEEEALLWFNISTGNLNNVTRDDTVLTPLTIESGVSTFKVFNIKFDISEDFEEGPTFTLYTIENETNPHLVSIHVSTGTYEVGVIAEDNNSNYCYNWTEVKVDSIWPIINSVTLNTTTPNAGDDILITVNATDNVAVTSVEANGIPLTHQGGDIWNGSITAQPDYHIIYVTAIDAAGLIDWNYSLGYFANNTPIGTDVQVEIPEIGATITFTNVIKSGQTYISEFNDNPSPPTGYNVLSNYYDIVTTAEYTGDITICIDYDDSEAVDEDKIKILHYTEMEDETEIFAFMQEYISEGYTVWNLNGTTYPDVLYGGYSESLHFVIDGTRLEINKSNFVYSTSIYDENGEPFIAWLDEPMFVIESWGNWYLAKMLISETHSLIVDNTMHLLEGYAITLIEIDVYGEEAWIVITKDGEEVESQVVRKGDQFIYEEDLNESGVDDNWVLRFYLENVSLDSNSIKINKTQLISPNLTIIDTPDDVTISNFSIRSINENTLEIRLDDPDDIISLEKGGIVNLIGDKFRFKLDENGDTGGVLKRQDVTGLWQDVTSSLDTDTNIICGVVTNLSDFVIVNTTPPPSNGNGNGGGGGGGASGENYYNIFLSETDRQSVYKNSSTSFSFDLGGNIIKHINFTALNSAGKVAAKVEILNNTSTLVSTPPPDEVYINLNIWVGNYGWATEKNMADTTVSFMVEKSWITDNNIDETTISLYRYSGNNWDKLVTRKVTEDSNRLYFEAETSGFSPFAVTGKTIGEPRGEGIIEPTVTAEKTPAPTPTEEKGIPGFGLFAGFSVLLIAVQLLRKKE